MLIGNVGKDPDIRYVAPDMPVATVTLATTNRAYTTREGKQIPESAEWHTIILWRNLAKTVEQFVHKGDKIYIEGELHNRSYTDRNGTSHTRCEIWAEKIEIFNFREEEINQQ